MEILLAFNQYIISAGSESLVNGIRDFIEPILYLILGIVAITFLFRREMTQFMIFIGISVVVVVLFKAPGLIINVAKNVGESTGNGGEWK